MSISFDEQEAVQAWERRAGIRSLLMAEATRQMLDAAQLRPGGHVLDVGTGTGDTALLAAQRVGPDGHVLAIDASPEMVNLARDKIEKSGVSQIEVRVMDGADLDLPEASHDAVIGRNAMMFLPGWPAPLQRFHRVLRPGGRLAFIVWASPEENPFFHLPVALVREHGWLRIPTDTVEIPFRLADADRLRADLKSAGFITSAVERVAIEVRISEAAPLLAYIREGPLFRANVDHLTESERLDLDEALVDAIERFREGSGYLIRAVSLVATGARP